LITRLSIALTVGLYLAGVAIALVSYEIGLGGSSALDLVNILAN